MHFYFMLVNRRNGMDAFPFCKVTHRVMRSRFGPHFTEMMGYPTDPKTVGEMIRKRRLDLGLRQIDAAKMIGCDEMSIVNWGEKPQHTARQSHGRSGGISRLQSVPKW